MKNNHQNRSELISTTYKIFAFLLITFAVGACANRLDPTTNQQPDNTDVPAATALQPVATGENSTATPQQEEISPTEITMGRTQFDGVTFSYPLNLIKDVRVERIPVTIDDSVSSEIPQPVQFTLETNRSTKTSTILIQPIREKNGQFYEALPIAKRDQVSGLESLFQTQDIEDPYAKLIQFVNGQGLRSVMFEDDDYTYNFSGLTIDGRYRVDFTYPVEVNESTGASQLTTTLSQIDGIIETIYIDSAAEALNVTNCINDAEFVENVTIPDGTEILAGEVFVKTWRMKNTGTCTWTSSYSWTFRGGDILTLLDATMINEVKPAEEIDISVTLVAPETPGTYSGQWQFSGADQFFSGFGHEVYYLITVFES